MKINMLLMKAWFWQHLLIWSATFCHVCCLVWKYMWEKKSKPQKPTPITHHPAKNPAPPSQKFVSCGWCRYEAGVEWPSGWIWALFVETFMTSCSFFKWPSFLFHDKWLDNLSFSPLGQPYNQLAILASSKGDHLTTIFYYCRSIAVKFPFPAASTNLQKALSKALER